MPPAGFSPSALPSRYAALRPLGRGVAGRVFEARDTLLGRTVALKVLEPPPGREAELVARLGREAALLAALDHPGIVRVFDVAVAPVPYIVMERVEGEGLEERVGRAGPLGLEAALALARDLLGALAHAHARGVVHRDVCPANVLVGPDGRAKLVDFGLARLDPDGPASTGASLLGSLDYAPPERLVTREAGVPGDLYGAAATLWFALAGRSPAADRSRPLEPPDPDRLPGSPSLARVLVAALARDPAARPADASALLAGLEAAAGEDPLEAAGAALALARDALHPLKNRLALLRRHAGDPAGVLARLRAEPYRGETLALVARALAGAQDPALARALAGVREALATEGAPEPAAARLAQAYEALVAATGAARELARAHLLDLGAWARGLETRLGLARLGLAVEVDPGLDPERLAADPAGLARALDRIAETLVANAAEAGARSLRLELGPGEGEGARLVFADDGPGLPPGDPEALFVKGASRKPGGSGLGLADARGLARRLGGALRAERAARGARFVLELPRRTRAEGGLP